MRDKGRPTYLPLANAEGDFLSFRYFIVVACTA